MTSGDAESWTEEEDYFRRFLVEEGLEDYTKIPVERIVFSRRTRMAFWFLRLYIILMVILVIIGFSHIV